MARRSWPRSQRFDDAVLPHRRLPSRQCYRFSVMCPLYSSGSRIIAVGLNAITLGRVTRSLHTEEMSIESKPGYRDGPATTVKSVASSSAPHVADTG